MFWSPLRDNKMYYGNGREFGMAQQSRSVGKIFFFFLNNRNKIIESGKRVRFFGPAAEWHLLSP